MLNTNIYHIRNIFRISGAILLILSIFLSHSCKKDKPVPPTVTTTAMTEISYTLVTYGGVVTNEGGAPVTSRGVCWNTSTKPTIANTKTTESGGLGSFTSNITQLTPSTLYYVRAYATNSAGTGYGNQVTFTTLQVASPFLTTTAITSITQTTAVSGGNITADNGSSVTARGVCWGTDVNPTTSNNKTSDATGTGIFTSTLTGLTGNTTYYVRAYATNSVGTEYGNQVSFKTSPLMPVLSTTTISSITQTTATSGGNVTSDGGAPVTARGVCWATTSTPTTANSKTPDGTGTGIFNSSLTELIAGTTYFVRAYATNIAGTGYGNQVSFTTSPVFIPPAITGFTPKSGTMGSQITLTGTHFNTEISGNTVRINDLIAAVTNASASELMVIVPEGAISGKISLTIGEITTTTADNFTVTDFENKFVVRGLYVQFEKRGWPSGYWSGDAIQEFNNFDAVVGHTVKEEIALQLDEMKKMGVNSIAFELRSSHPIWNPGPFLPPECNIGPGLGLQYPQPTLQEIANLTAFLDLVDSKQIKVLLRLVNTYMEEQPPLNNATWLGTILNAIKNHPALELVLFEGTTHLVDTNGDGEKDQCGIPAEPPLWLGPSSVPANYVKWAIQYGMTLGLPANKLSAECIVGSYITGVESPAGPEATDRHLWRPVKVLKQIFDDLAVPESQRTYAISFYLQRKCENANGVPCVDADASVWAEETWKNVFEIIGRKDSRVVAVEMGLNKNDPNLTTEQAFETHIKLIKRYGVAGGCFWRWVFFDDNEENDPTLATPIKKRGLTFEYNPVKDKMAQYYLGM